MLLETAVRLAPAQRPSAFCVLDTAAARVAPAMRMAQTPKLLDTISSIAVVAAHAPGFYNSKSMACASRVSHVFEP